MKDAMIYNLHAAKGAKISRIKALANAMAKVGIHPELMETERPMHAAELVVEAVKNGAERVFAVGGDGSMNEVVNGMMAAAQAGLPMPALAVLPHGRGNDFATALNLPRTPETIAEMLHADKRREVDICAAGDGTFERYFLNGSGFGIDSAINYHATKSILKGKASYLDGLVCSIKSDLLHQNAHFTVDGVEFDMRMVLFAAMNGRQEGGGFKIAPNYALDDGLLELIIMGDGLPALKLISLIPRLASGRTDHPDIHQIKAKSVHVHLDPQCRGLYSQVDGEGIIENGHDFYARVTPTRLSLVIP